MGGNQSGAADGILNTGGNLGGLIAPALTPWIAARYGWSESLYFGCFIVLVGAMLWFIISPAKAGWTVSDLFSKDPRSRAIFP
jgi:sugar phosphate permease